MEQQEVRTVSLIVVLLNFRRYNTVCILTKKGPYMNQYLCEHVGIWANSNQARNRDFCNNDFGLTQLRYQWFGKHLDNGPQIGTPIRQSLVSTQLQRYNTFLRSSIY